MKILVKLVRFIFLISVLVCLFGINSYSQTVYDWTGLINTNWTNVGNWQVGGVAATVYPGQTSSTDIADFGVNHSYFGHNQPVINSGNNITIASLNMGDNGWQDLLSTTPQPGRTGSTGYEMNLRVNGILTITGTFTQIHSTQGIALSGEQVNDGSNAPYTYSIQNALVGSGIINCGSFTVGDGTTPANNYVIGITRVKVGSASTFTINIAGDLTCYTPIRGDGTGANNIISENFAELSFVGGTINLSGQLKLMESTTAFTAQWTPQYSPLASYSMDLFKTADSPTINFFNATPVSIQIGAVRNGCDFYNIVTTGGTGTTNVNYVNTGVAQDVPIYRTGGTIYNFIDHTPSVYNNVGFGGNGTKSVSPTNGTFSVNGQLIGSTLYGGNFTLAAGNEIVDISTNNPILTIGQNYSSGTGSTLTKSNTSALTIPGTTNNGGTFNHSGNATITLTGAFNNSGVYNQTGGGAVTANSTTNNTGIYNQSGTGQLTFTGAVTNINTINQTSSGNILFSNTFYNSGSSSSFSQTGGGTSTFTGAVTNDGQISQNGTGVLTFNNTFSNTLGGSAFSVSSGITNFNNTYTNNGTFTQTGGTVNINQSGAQSLIDNSAGGTTFSNVFFQNGGTKTLSGIGGFFISDIGVLNMAASTTLASGDILTINSDVDGSGTVAAIPSGCSITGNVTVQRYISANRAYRLMSSPVFAANDGTNNYYSINYLLANTVIEGDGGGPYTKPGNPTLYLWRENIVPQYTTFLNSNYRGISDISDPASYGMDDAAYPTTNIPVGNGYLFFYRGSTNQASVADLTIPGAPSTTDTLSAVGTLNQGNVTVHDWYTPGSANLGWTTTNAGNASVQGINLMGNPYASSIDWDKIDSVVSTGPIYVQHLAPFSYQLIPTGLQGAGNYNVYQAGTGGVGTVGTANSNIIASGEGFLVQALSASASITFSELAKSNTVVTGANLYMAKKMPAANPPQFLRLQLAKDSINTDGIIIRFAPNTQSKFNPAEDAHYHKGLGKVSLASLSSDDQPLAINQLPLALKGDTIKLNVGARANGNYTLNLKSITGVPQIYAVWLKDAHNKDLVNMRTTASYSFAIDTADTTTFGSSRFSLMILQDPALAYKLLSFDATKAGNDNKQVQLTWKTKNEENYTNFTVERSNDNGKHFDIVGGMLSSGVGSYSLVDKDPLKGHNLYRLKQLDFNNTATYSNLVEIDFNGNNDSGHLSCYPNPAFSDIHLSFDPKVPGKTSYDVKVTNSSGMIVRYAVITEPDWQANVSNLLTGTYLIQVTDKKDNSVVGQAKFVKL